MKSGAIQTTREPDEEARFHDNVGKSENTLFIDSATLDYDGQESAMNRQAVGTARMGS